MAIRAQPDMETGVAHDGDLEVLQAILTAQGKPVSYEEVAGIGYELLGFFEALGEENGQIEEDSRHA
jgi:hypothetical protein